MAGLRRGGLRMDVYGIITRRGHVLSPAAEVMLEAIRESVVEERALLRRSR
jgi:hypothetical protein